MREINHLSLQQWLRSAIPDSQQPTSPIGFLFLKLPPPPCAVLLVILVISGVTLFRPFITRVIAYLVSGMNHQVLTLVTNEQRKGPVCSQKSLGWSSDSRLTKWIIKQVGLQKPWTIQLWPEIPVISTKSPHLCFMCNPIEITSYN